MTDEISPPPSPEARLLELERRLTEQEATHQARLVQSELKSHAVRAGMVDLDGLKLLDASKVKLTPAGEVEGADRLMTDLRRAKPWLFHAANSSTPATPPPSTPPAAKRATTMTHDEWQAARAELLRRH